MSVNVNTLPTRGLDRVDILRDGASAVYGSDAVAGVINFVTDKDYEGNELQIQSGATEIGSGNDYGLTWTHGNFAFDQKLHWISTFDFFNRDALETHDLPSAVDSNKVALAPDGFNGINGPFFDRNSSSGYPSFRRGSATQTLYITPVAAGGVAFKSTAPARTGAELGYYYDVNADGYSVPKTRRFNWFNGVDFNVSDSVTAFGELAAYRAEIAHDSSAGGLRHQCGSPARRAGGQPLQPPTARASTVPRARRMPTARPASRARREAATIVSKRFTEAGAETIEVETTFWRALAGARGKFNDNWTWESAALYSVASTDDDSQNAIRESALLDATNRTDASAYNPFGYTFKIANGAVVPDQVYLNPAATIDPFIQKFHQEGKNTLSSVDVRVNGKLWELPAGPIQLAVGAEHRWDDYELTRPEYAGVNGVGNGLGLDPANNDYVQASAAGDVIGDRTVYAGFAETVVPIFGPQNALPGAQRLELGASMRYEHYSDFGSTSNPKFTLDWRPIEPLMIRASYNEGFRRRI